MYILYFELGAVPYSLEVHSDTISNGNMCLIHGPLKWLQSMFFLISNGSHDMYVKGLLVVMNPRELLPSSAIALDSTEHFSIFQLNVPMFRPTTLNRSHQGCFLSQAADYTEALEKRCMVSTQQQTVP